MALPSPTKVSGKHNAIFEAYYRQIDPKGVGTIQAMDAAKFLKKSALSDVVLSRIWDLSDPNAKGYLDKPGFFVALKLVSLAQCGQVIKMSNIFFETENPPRVGEIPKIIPQKVTPGPPGSNDWAMKPGEREKYENLFQSLKPVNGLLHGGSVKKVLMDSKLPMETLGKIWDLADQDRDGSLDKHEFTIAMHLVYQALEKRAVPEVLPIELQKPKPGAPPPVPPAPAMPKAPSGNFNDGGFVANFPKDIGPPPVPPIPAAIPAPLPPLSSVPPMVPPSIQPSSAINLISTEPIIPTATAPTTQQPVDWVITPPELLRYETMFRESDRDKDGLVSGLEVKNVFLQSGVPQNCLAHIWALCDTHQTGKLTLEQFALAMWMVERKKMNIEPPEALTPNMVPPSLRAIVKGVDVVAAEPKPTYSNPELEMISKEIEELSRERRALETDIAQKEADIRIKTGEIRSLQSELDTLMATLKQLENQKGEAQKRLDDLKNQTDFFVDEIEQINGKIDVTRYKVNKIREQCQKQEETINEQEGELNAKRSELQKLKDEETALEKEYELNRKELDKLTNQLSYTQLGISQVRASLTQLLELERQMTDALLLCKAAVDSQDTHIVSEYSLQIEPDFTEARQLLEKSFEPPQEEETKPDPFSGANETSNTTKVADSFGDHDAFSSSMVNNNNGWGDGDTFNAKFDDGFGGDAFGTNAGSNLKADPFNDARQTSASPIPPGKDDFGSDPFASLHAPTGQGKILSPNAQKSGPPPRPESPSPALPPKKSKQPPPRPAPPRPLQGPTRPAPPTQDAFGSTGGGGFADFDDFDNKQPSLPPPPQLSFLNSYNKNNTLPPPQPLPLFNNNKNNTKSKSIFTSTINTTTTNALNTKSKVNIDNNITSTLNTNNTVISSSRTNTNTNQNDIKSTSFNAIRNIQTSSSPLLDTIFSTSNNTLITNTSTFINNSNTTLDTYSDIHDTINNNTMKNKNNNADSNVLKNYQRTQISPLPKSASPKMEEDNDDKDDKDDKMKFDENNFNANFVEFSLSQTQNKENFQNNNDLMKNTTTTVFDNEFNNGKISEIGAKNKAYIKINKNNININKNSNNNSAIEVISKVIPVTSTVPAPTEFADDPFKDYRYEDIFNIEDPFADDDNDDDAEDTDCSEDSSYSRLIIDFMSDPFSSDAKKNTTIIDSSSNNVSKVTDLIENFKLTPVSSPTPNQDNVQLTANSPSPQSIPLKKTKISRPLSNSEFVADFANFDAFNLNDDFNLKTETTIKNNKSLNNNNNNSKNNNNNLFDTNSNDAFNATTNTMQYNLTTSTKANSALENKKTQNNLNNNFIADFSKVDVDNFFESFNDNFITSSPANVTEKITVAQATTDFKSNKVPTADPFDAFGDGKTTRSSKVFNANFEDDFFKTVSYPTISDASQKTVTLNAPKDFSTANTNLLKNNNSNNNNNVNSKKNDMNNLYLFGDSSFDDDFANFETTSKDNKKSIFGKNDLKAWSFGSNKKDKKTMLSENSKSNHYKDTFDYKKKSYNQHQQQQKNQQSTTTSSVNSEVMEKFADDYSKPDTFDADFEEAIRRSMLDK
ncbi:uncharacterized protein DDB_G0283357 isoform X2 [Condylostylus longicornis]|uniref:uncharacterized protein DDB_G0283357 isoform X2 n=1 Tax=Condylostylus longicornis TaxID=2530218 RepID=UPI00244E1C5C|nr:uncharacterized protein DDB_G0283357 isoform X2 [Condylostylus longicornis]